ncbi:MAG: DUF86 domain-containing protein [bacterium]|nr:DUF86 domain-containing protein [bacterium]
MISGYLSEIEPFLKYTNEEIKTDKSKLRNIERLFQLIVDTAIDINSHIISEMNMETPEEYRGTFIMLGKNSILPYPFAEKISGSVGLRNNLIHQYEKIDADRALNDIKNNISDYVEYIKIIKVFVDSKKSS